jgi:hypothetical protein
MLTDGATFIDIGGICKPMLNLFQKEELDRIVPAVQLILNISRTILSMTLLEVRC